MSCARTALGSFTLRRFVPLAASRGTAPAGRGLPHPGPEAVCRVLGSASLAARRQASGFFFKSILRLVIYRPAF